MSNSPENKPSEQPANEERKEDENSLPAASYNPSISDEEGEDKDLQKIKGDAIGDTLYSERFVLSTLMKLSNIEKDLSEDEPFEKDLCSLWDMTIEKDVVKLLLEHKVLDLFATTIATSEDKRLTEILVGIIGNMCSVKETREELCNSPDVMSPILELISCSDSLTLIQLMRFFHAVLVFESSGDESVWFQHFRNAENFVDNYAFVLCNSINRSLLLNAYEALDAICAKFVLIEVQGENDQSFCDVFVKPNLVEGVIEAFKTLLPANSAKDSNDDTSTPSQNSQKIMSLFLDINVVLSQYDKVSRDCYDPIMSEFMKCISQVLAPLCQPICLLPLTVNEQGIVENLNEIFQALGDPFDDVCCAKMITIWNLIESDRENKTKSKGEWGESEEVNDEEINSEDICLTIFEFLTRTVKNATDSQLRSALKLHTKPTVLKLLDALSAGDSEDDISECCTRINDNLESNG